MERALTRKREGRRGRGRNRGNGKEREERKRENEAPVNSIIAYTSINYTSRAIIAIIRMNMNTIYETRVPAWLRSGNDLFPSR